MAGRGVSRGVFAENLIKYRLGANIGAYHCLSHSTNDSIGFVHIFGSNATGPYTLRNGPEFVGPLMDSPGRIHVAMKLYYDTFPHPDRIFFNSILWDLQLLRQVPHFLRLLSSPRITGLLSLIPYPPAITDMYKQWTSKSLYHDITVSVNLTQNPHL